MQKELCIIIHGFAGNPWEVKPLADALEQKGYEIITPLLPGHRINNERMGKTNALDWIEMIETLVKNAIGENKKIHMIGFSMGSMIASIIAYRYKLSTLVLLSPSLYVLSPYVLKTKITNIFQNHKENRSLSDDDRTLYTKPSIIRSAPISNMFQFQKIVRHAKKVFQHITIPICIIHGQRDEIADPRSSDWIYRTVSSKVKEIYFLPFSKHHICRDCEAETVIQKVIAFIGSSH